MTNECTTPVIIACVELDLGFGIAAQRDPQAGALPYRAVLDSCVVRALPAAEGVDGWLAVAEATTLRA